VPDVEPVRGRVTPPATAGPGSTPEPDQPPPEARAPRGLSRRATLGGGLWNAASTVAPMGSTLLLSIVISRELGANALGEQSLVAYVASLMFSVLIYSFTTASVQLLASASGARDDARLAWLSRWSYGAHVVSGVVTAGVMVATGLGRNSYSELWFLAGTTAVVDAIGWAHASRNVARRGWTATSARRLIAQSISPLAGITAIYAGAGVAGVFVAHLVVALALMVALRLLDRRDQMPVIEGRAAPAWNPVLRLWSLFTVAALITQIVERRLELVFLDAFHDARTVAMYSVAFSIVAIPATLASSLVHAAMPAIASRHAQDPTSVVQAVSPAARVMVTVGMVLAAGSASIGPGLVRSVYGPGFVDAAHLVPWLSLALVIGPLGSLCSALWAGVGTLRPVLVSGGLGAVLDVTLAWLLIPSSSTTGAVIATLTAQGVTALTLIGYTLGGRFRIELRPGRLAASALVAVTAGAAAAATSVAIAGLPGDLVAIVPFAAVLAVGSRLVGLFSQDDVAWLAGSIPGPAARALRAVSPRR